MSNITLEEKTSKDLDNNIPAPKRGDEQWRFASLKHLSFDNFSPTGDISEAEKEQAKKLAEQERFDGNGVNLTIINDNLIEFNQTRLPEGVICLPLSEARQKHPEKVAAHFMKQEAKLGSKKYAAIHEKHASEGLFLYVPEDTSIEAPIEVCYISSKEHTISFPHTLVVLEKGAKATVIDRFLSLDQEIETWTLGVNDLIAADNSELNYLALQELNHKSRIIQLTNTSLGTQTKTKTFLLNTGALWARQESLSRLQGEESRSDMLAISLPTGKQEYDQRTFQHHISPRAYSDLLYKNTLFDNTKTVFSGLIYVDEGAHDTDAYQTCRNILLSEEAEANSMPGLEINADQVKCSHGSTSACLSQDEVHYLMSRGIDEKTAKRLVARGFSVEVVERLEDKQTQEHILKLIDRKFAQHG